MVKKYRFGTPIETDAVIENIDITTSLPAEFSTNDNVITIPLSPDDIVYGLGENIRGINKRGWVYDSFCMDDFIHSEDKHSLYGAHNFFVISSHASIFYYVMNNIILQN